MRRLECVCLGTAISLVVFQESKAQDTYDTYAYYLSREECEGTPNRVDTYNQGYYESLVACEDTCKGYSLTWKSYNTMCDSPNFKANVSTVFGNASYMLQEAYESDCETFLGASALIASGNCEQVVMYVEQWGHSLFEVIQLQDNGSLSLRYFTDQNCESPLSGDVTLTFQINATSTDVDSDLLNSSSCDANGYRWTYFEGTASSDSSDSNSSSGAIDSGSAGSSVPSSTETSSSSSSNVGMIAGIAGGVLVVVVVVVVFIFCRRRSTRNRSGGPTQTAGDFYSPASGQQRTSSLTRDDPSSLGGGILGQSGLWSDDVITAKRISRRDVETKQLISRGAFGEVYAGTFDGSPVAVKMLLPETRGIIRHVNAFLSEAKMTAMMDHPRIISLVGVAWNSLSDLCVVMEFMDGGDLRALLSKYESCQHPVGIDRPKATIALHVCHALTYLHSLSPAVIHRDLKSRNVLLNRNLEAKVTDFGISREQLDRTMTAGVGTSLWMAPEVMLGERYDDKADIFSFGVVLSELDVHTLPYARAKDKNHDSNGRKLPDAILLQQVTMGKLCVDFSSSSPKAIVELGLRCVSVDPNLRPSAAEALYKLQVILANELC